ncbi:uncharacterized protein LOC107490235 [Arachis duranensis]|uniref:Uncharacterized protein LOC107490235 n=1 Tax=Arachis duranensis TaxID=130453 RepID=A0A9C6TAI0_ARADU|nr:uncharacterized protein LOC107490235 [Arachis duranensis]
MAAYHPYFMGHERSSIGVSDLRLFWELPRNFAIFMRDVKEGSFTRISRLLIFFSLRLLSLRYLIPGFFMHGIVDEKTDVYAYGVLLLELITGRQALDSSQKSLIMWAGYATLAIGTEWIFRPKQEVISLVLCSCDVLLLLLTVEASPTPPPSELHRRHRYPKRKTGFLLFFKFMFALFISANSL